MSDQTQAPEVTPLDMAVNLARHVAAYGETAHADPLTAHVNHYGARQAASAEVAAHMALVSIAQDIHRIRELLETRESSE
jgi:hypothetical protein